MSNRPWILLFAIILTSFVAMRKTQNSIQLLDRSLLLLDDRIHVQTNGTELMNSTNNEELENVTPGDNKKSKTSCTPMAAWQRRAARPSCNAFHEIDMTTTNVELLASGSYRHVWKVYESNGTPRVVKTLHYRQEFDAKNTRRHKHDAMALEQLSSSPYIVDIYGYCSNSALVDYTSDGDLTRLHTTNHSKQRAAELMKIAHDVAASIADSHSNTIVHSDIKPNQFLNFNGKYLLNDFNRAHFLKWNSGRNETSCGFTETKNWGAWRSPEEYLYEPQTEAIDVYSLGHVLNFVLAKRVPFGNLTTKKAVEFVKKGGREYVTDESILYSTHPYDRALVQVLDMCFEYNATKRASARQVMNVLRRALDEAENSSYIMT